MNRKLENLEKFAELLKRDASLQKIGIESGSELQKKIDRAIERIDSGDIPACLIRPKKIEPGHD
jgi:hypothetical protein